MSKSRLLELRKILDKHAHLYYVLDKPEISDYEYDKLYQELVTLEAKYPELYDVNSVTQKVGGTILDSFLKVTHESEMYSLNNAFSFDDLRAFDKRMLDALGSVEYNVEYKIDGLAISLIYEDGDFKQAITRGDGIVGEDVTNNIRTIKSLPLKIDYLNKLEIRGEVFINKLVFTNINKERSNEGLQLFRNARNAAAGSVRQLDSSVAAKRNLDAYFYTVVNPELANLKSQSEALKFLSDLGFHTQKHNERFTNIEDVIKYINVLEAEVYNLDYDIDGIVIKVNDFMSQNKVGYTSKFPRFAIAYKFAASEVESEILDIFVSVGRTGKITPNAKLKPVMIDGSLVSFAQLHNEDMIKEKDIRVSDKVIVRKAGEIIPEVVRVLFDKRDGSEEVYQFVSNCPICNSKLVRAEDESHHYCLNMDCPARIEQSLIHFSSREAMNIVGLGEAIIKRFYENNLLTSIEDIYTLENKVDQILEMEGFKEKSVNNLINSINNSKNSDLDKFIVGLGIRHVGSRASKALVDHFKSLDEILKASVEDLVLVADIGEITAKSIYDFFNNEKNIEMINNLKALGLEFSFEDKEVDTSSMFSDKNVVITGSFENYSRKELTSLLESLNAKVVSSVSKNTDLLIYGSSAGSKYEKAVALNVDLLSESEFLNEVEKYEKDN